MPPLYEGDLLYMPTTFPGISPTKARQILQITDHIIKSFPEVKTVFGKAGRAETATDPAPMDMIETTIQLKPEAEWPAVDIKDDNGRVIAHRRRTPDELTDALNDAVQIPGLNNAWTMPIITRIDMLSTGIKTPVGIKVAGPDLANWNASAPRSRRRHAHRAGHGQRLCRARHGRAVTSNLKSTATPSPVTA
jgi:Cu(I)/Ag(I) efflux system membrane protein CusA/SilA